MSRRTRYSLPILAVVLVGFLLRAIAPAGYMPAAAGTGLLFELCPDALPVGVSLAHIGHEHHHHHAGSDTPDSDACDVGHLLAGAEADAGCADAAVAYVPGLVPNFDVQRSVVLRAPRYYAPRAPPVT